ncbi:hypothetical protein B0H12DRAFT_1011431, partial [Mycena haematopus]
MPTIDLRKRLAELDAQIDEHRRALHDLQEVRTAVAQELSATATFPFLTLPVEITTEIFILSLPQFAGLGWDRSVRQYGNAVPISLTLVCRTWRNIALATPALW